MTPEHETLFLTQREAAALLRLSERTLERYRREGTGPPFCAFGRRRLYSRGDVFAWAEACKRISTSHADGIPKRN